MALTIYKISEYVDWAIDGQGGGGGGGGTTIISPVDLSNYYTKTELNTAGLSIVDWANIVNYPYVYTFPSSVDNVGNAIQLENDELNPGNNQYYGTNASGIKGWWPLTGGTGGALLPRNQILYWNVAQNWYQPYPAKPIPGGGGGGGGTLIGGALYNWAAAKGIPEQPPVNNEALELTFDDIVNNPYATVAEWNTFFDLPNYGVPFTSMSISGDTVRLFGSQEGTIIVKEALFYQEPFSSNLIGIDDKRGSIIEVKYQSFYGLNYVTLLKFPMLATVGVESFSSCGQSADIPGITSDFHRVITVGIYSFSASTFLSFDFPVLNVAGDYSFSSQGYCTNISMPQLLGAGESCFYGLIVIEDISLPNLLTAGSSCFALCVALKTVNLPKCTAVGGDLFNAVSTLTYISMPAVTDLGGTTGDDNVFYQTGTTLTLVIPATMTIDGDVTWLIANNTVILPNNIPSNILILTFDDITNASGMIVGDATLLADWNTAFGSPASPFTGISVVGDVVTLSGGSDITVPDSLFSTDWDNYGHLISIVDTGCIVAAGYNSFGDYDVDGSGTILETAILPALTQAGEGCFYYNPVSTISLPALTTAGAWCFASCSSVTTISLPALTTAGESCFASCSSVTTISLPALTTTGNYCFYACASLTTISLPSLTTAGESCFYICGSSLTTINLPVLTSLGSTVEENGVFYCISGKVITLTIPSALMTNNGGNPDGDIQYLTTYNTVTIINT